MCQMLLWTRLTPISPRPIFTPFGLRWGLIWGWTVAFHSFLLYLERNVWWLDSHAPACSLPASEWGPGNQRVKKYQGNSIGNIVSETWGQIVLELSVLAEFSKPRYLRDIKVLLKVLGRQIKCFCVPLSHHSSLWSSFTPFLWEKQIFAGSQQHTWYSTFSHLLNTSALARWNLSCNWWVKLH